MCCMQLYLLAIRRVYAVYLCCWLLVSIHYIGARTHINLTYIIGADHTLLVLRCMHVRKYIR
jgi:hypothetical protein